MVFARVGAGVELPDTCASCPRRLLMTCISCEMRCCGDWQVATGVGLAGGGPAVPGCACGTGGVPVGAAKGLGLVGGTCRVPRAPVGAVKGVGLAVGGAAEVLVAVGPTGIGRNSAKNSSHNLCLS